MKYQLVIRSFWTTAKKKIKKKIKIKTSGFTFFLAGLYKTLF
jgi:hypothetical protein